MSKYFVIFVVGVIFAQILGCTISTPSSPASLQGLDSPETVTVLSPTKNLPIVSTPTVLPTSPLDTATSAPTLRPTTTPVPEQLLSTVPMCANDGQPVDYSPTDGISGAILYKQVGDTNLSIIGGTPLKKTHISLSDSDLIENFGVSPNGKWLAFSKVPERDEQTSTFQPDIFLVSSSGEMIRVNVDTTIFQSKMSDDEFIDFWAGEWFNDHYMKIKVFTRTRGGQMSYPLDPQLLDPFTSEWQLSPPEILDDDQYVWSPDQSKGFSSEQSSSMIRYFITYGTEIRSRKRLEMTRLQNDAGYPGLSLNGVLWSPDSRFLAMLFSYSKKDTDRQTIRVLVYDTENHTYIFQCGYPRTGVPESWVNYPLTIVWSPDSNAFIANVSVIPHTFLDPNILLFDLRRKKVFQFLQGAEALGWSSEYQALLDK